MPHRGPHLRSSGDFPDLDTILNAAPDVVGHNLETVKRLYPLARPQADYYRSLDILEHISGKGFIAKSGVMIGLGERTYEMEDLMHDAAERGVSIFTIGQYLQPTREHLPVREYIHPDIYAEYKKTGMKCGLQKVISGPLVRSSYHAKEAYEALTIKEKI
ncbi:MAG: hypothetical protein U5N56_09170 [Candidatus Marinimicrobia bacterium]|nr:hypothetical protein [Candidatus Neomarinimicrobiota bacterium]